MTTLARLVRPRLVHGLTAAVAVVLFAASWLLRFNDPGGSFAGLTDDHFFYLVRGWQLLFGDLPVRDFVDHGAPLFYYIGAAVQIVFGRGTLSELAFTVTMLSLCASMTFVLATRASGWMLAGVLGAAFQILLEPRYYNYPKLLVYVVAIPLIWRYANAPTIGRVAAVAGVSVVGFLFRHDHGLFVGVALLALLLALNHMPWQVRLRHAAVYAALCALLVAPYLVFIQINGGLLSYFDQAAAWAERDRDRAPVIWPGLLDNPDGISEAAMQGGPVERAVATVRDNLVAWVYYLELALPVLALALLALSVDAFRPGWPHARAKLFSVAVLALALDAGFLRSPLEARLADPTVPLAILVAWMAVAVPRLLATTSALMPRLRPFATPLRAAVLVVALPMAFVVALTVSQDFYRRLDRASMTDRWGKAFDRVGQLSDYLREAWRLEWWLDQAERPDLLDLSMYLNACTAPTDRVLVQAYLPQVVALARRAFAGGHADLRPGFFGSDEAQRLTIARLKAHSVPVALLETGESYDNFREEFPLITAYLDRHYRIAGTRVFDERFGTTLLVRRDLQPRGVYAPFGWPCYGSGRVQSSARRPSGGETAAAVRPHSTVLMDLGR